MKHVWLALGVAVLGVVALEAQRQKPPVPMPIFVTSVGAVNGFTDPNKDNQDTMKDLREAIQKDHRETLVLTEKREEARIVLVVMNRDRALKALRSPDSTLSVKFIFGDFETEMSASANGSSFREGPWKRAAGRIANQVEEWIIANGAKLAGG